MGWKAWTRERLTSAQLQELLQDQAVLQFASVSAANAAIPSGSRKAGMIISLPASGSYPARLCIWNGSAWRLLAVALRTVSAAWTEAAGQFGNAKQLITTLAITGPPEPWVLGNIVIRGELGSTAAGTRWDMSLELTANGAAAFEFDKTLGEERVSYQQLITGISPTVILGDATLSLYELRAYGSANGQVNSTNRRFTATIFGVQ